MERRAASDLARHILPSSGTMIGICTTLIGLVKIVEARIGPSRVDELAAIIAIVFMFSAVLSYLSIRVAMHEQVSRKCEQLADLVFIVGLVSIAIVAGFFAFEWM